MAPGREANNVIIGGILLHLSLGSLYAWGCIQPYVASYIRLYDASVTTRETTMVYACACLGHALAAPLVGPIQTRLGFRGSAMAGVSLVVLSMLGCAQATTVAQLSAMYSMFGVGLGLTYTCPLVCGYAWMPNSKGKVSGFISAGFGAGAAVFDAVATVVVNPGNLSPDPTTGYYGKEITDRVPLMFVVLGACCLLLGMVGSSMLSLPPPGGFAEEPAGVYSKLTSGVGSNNYSSVSTDRSAFESLEKSSNAECSEDSSAGLQEQGLTPQTNILGADRGEAVAVAEEGQVGHNDLTTRPVTTLLLHSTTPASSPDMQGLAHSPSAGMQGSGRLREESRADMGNATKSAVHLSELGCARSQGGAHVKGGVGVTPQRQFEVWDLLFELDYYHLFLCMALTSVSGLYIIGSYKRVGQHSFANGDRFLSILGGFASLCNASGRIIGGVSVDRFGCFPTLVVMSFCMACTLLSLDLVETSRLSFFFAVCLVHMMYGSNFAIYPTLVADFFGNTTAGPNFGLVFLGYGLLSFLGMFCLSRFNQNSEVFLACAGFSLIGASCAAFLWGRRWSRGQLLLARQQG